MPRSNNHIFIKLVVVLIGLVYMLKLLNIIRISNSGFVSYALLVYGFISVYCLFNTDRKAFLFVSTTAFLTGVLMFILNNFVVMNPSPVILPAVMFILGGGFLMLYLENYVNTIFIYCAAVLISFSVVFITLSRFYFIRRPLTILGDALLDYYPVLLILTGLIILMRKKS